MTNEEKRAWAVYYAWEWIGRPYIYGGNGPYPDCSGFAQIVLRAVGMDPPGDQRAIGLYKHFKASTVLVPKAGCVVFFGRNTTDISHVAVMLTDELMIEAAGGGSNTTTIEEANRVGAYVMLSPLSRRKDLVAIVDPFQASNG